MRFHIDNNLERIVKIDIGKGGEGGRGKIREKEWGRKKN